MQANFASIRLKGANHPDGGGFRGGFMTQVILLGNEVRGLEGGRMTFSRFLVTCGGGPFSRL